MRQKYTILIDVEWPPSEVAATHFMTEVFRLAEESHLSGKELKIIREERPEKTLEERLAALESGE